MYSGHITDAVLGFGNVDIRSIILLTRRCLEGCLNDGEEDDEDVEGVDAGVE
jgi:hypothetical protein